MREIKFRATHTQYGHAIEYLVITLKPHYKCQGYVMRKVNEHPFMNKRGYVPEHRLIMEQKIGRFLKPRKEFIHHIDQNRSNNDLQNLKLQGHKEHAKGHDNGKRNKHGQFLCQEPIFNELKFRLLNKNTNLIEIYTLNELISTTYRRGQFEFRGRFTGLKDSTGREIFEGDMLDLSYMHDYIIHDDKKVPVMTGRPEGITEFHQQFIVKDIREEIPKCCGIMGSPCKYKVIGNIYEKGVKDAKSKDNKD